MQHLSPRPLQIQWGDFGGISADFLLLAIVLCCLRWQLVIGCHSIIVAATVVFLLQNWLSCAALGHAEILEPDNSHTLALRPWDLTNHVLVGHNDDEVGLVED